MRLNGALMEQRHRELYFAFILAKPHKDVLYDYLRLVDLHTERFARNSNKPGSVLAWRWADIAQAAIYAYQATGEERFVELILDGAERAFEFTDQKLGKSDDFGNVYLEGWGLPEKGKWGREETLPGRIISPILELQLELEKNPSLQTRFGQQMEGLTSRGLTILQQYLKLVRSNSKGQAFFTYLWTDEHDAINHMAAYFQAISFAYRINGDRRFRDALVGFRKYFLDYAQVVGEAYVWPYQVLSDSSKMKDTRFWKAAITVNALVNMHNNGIKLPRRDQVRLARSFLNLVHRDFHNINAYVSSEHEFLYTGYNALRSTFSGAPRLSNWIVLDQFIPKVERAVSETVASRWDLYPIGWFAEPYDAVAYAYRLRNWQGEE
jgi:hypothetical protein